MTPFARVLRVLRAFVRALGIALLVPVLLFEEWGWEPLAALMARLARLPFWARLENHLRQLPPWGALLAFFVPVMLLLPVKVLALFLFSRGHAATALTVLVLAKLVGTVRDEIMAPQGLSVWARAQRTLQPVEAWETFRPWIERDNPRLAFSVA
eukprot:gene53376-72940_t